MNTLFIQTNYKQMLGAKLGKYSFEKEAGPDRNFETQIMVVEKLPEMRDFVGKTYLTTGKLLRTYTFDDLQSFTLTRFKPPELMGYDDSAIVVDPDIFALPKTNINELFDLDLGGNDLAACKRENPDGGEGKWESSVMLLDCQKLKHWHLASILKRLEEKSASAADFKSIRNGEKVLKLPWTWNSMDKINDDSKLLHTTKRLTQPWKTGLQIDFTPSPLPKIFGLIPREPIHKLLGKYPTHYLPHPDKKVVDFFFSLVKSALKDGAISEQEIQDEINKKNVRPDIFEVLKNY